MAHTRTTTTRDHRGASAIEPADVWWLLQEVAALCRRLSDRQYTAVSSSADQVQALRLLASGEPLTVGELSRQLGLERNSGSQLVERLVQRGLIERTRSTDDRRRVQIEIASDGRALLDNAQPYTLGMITAATDGISAELLALGSHLLSALRAGTVAALQSSEHTAWQREDQRTA